MRGNRGGRGGGGGGGRRGGGGRGRNFRQGGGDNAERAQRESNNGEGRGGGSARSSRNVDLVLEPRRIGVVILETFEVAREQLGVLAERAREYDQLNIVIRAEGNMDDPELSAVGRVYAGTAWATIHERRIKEGWYEAVDH